MENIETRTDKAMKIIRQKDRTPDDIIKLSQISMKMAALYREARVQCAKMEWEYNKERPRVALEEKEARKISMAQADKEGKLFAENRYWKYRIYYEECVGMRAVLEQIDAFRISYYRREKGIDSALMDNNHWWN